MIDIDKELGIFSIEEILEHTKPYLEDIYTGTSVYELEEVYKMFLSLSGYDDNNEFRQNFHQRMFFHTFPTNIAII